MSKTGAPIAIDAIGALPAAWNWLQGWRQDDVDAKAVHFTLGTPDAGNLPRTPWDAEWAQYADAIRGQQ